MEVNLFFLIPNYLLPIDMISIRWLICKDRCINSCLRIDSAAIRCEIVCTRPKRHIGGAVASHHDASRLATHKTTMYFRGCSTCKTFRSVIRDNLTFVIVCQAQRRLLLSPRIGNIPKYIQVFFIIRVKLRVRSFQNRTLIEISVGWQ